MRTRLAAILLVLVPGTAVAEPTALLHGRVGGLVPSLFNELSPSYSVELGGGWVVPALDHRLAAVLDLAYSAPTLEATRKDARVPGGSYRYDLTQHDLRMFVGGHWHFADLLAAQLVPYAGAGLRLHFRRTVVDGSAGGESFGTSEETSTGAGAAVRGGLGLRLGPGLGTFQLEADVAPIDHRITGDANHSSLTAQIGYTLVL